MRRRRRWGMMGIVMVVIVLVMGALPAFSQPAPGPRPAPGMAPAPGGMAGPGMGPAAGMRPGARMRAGAAMRPGGQARAGQRRMPMPMLRGGRDPEMTAMVRDIVILRAINNTGMTVDQMQKLIPLLEQVAAADRELRTSALSQLRIERQRLLEGTATAEETRQAQKAVQDSRRQYVEQVKGTMSQAGGFLSDTQAKVIQRIVMGGMAQQQRPGAPGAADQPGQPRAVGASAEAVQRLVDLLKEKVAAMSGAASK